MGLTPVERVIFYLWTDPDEINTACVKLKENYFLFSIFFFILDIASFWKNYVFHVFFLISKEEKAKTTSAGTKTSTVLESALNFNQKLWRHFLKKIDSCFQVKIVLDKSSYVK